MSKQDILNEEDVKLLVDSFYKKVLVDPLIGFIFTTIVKLSWDTHLPIMYGFWSSILFGTKSYNGSPMGKHFELDKSIKLTKIHFDRWLELWENTIYENFKGERADEALSRAKNIAALMLFKIEEQRQIS